MVMENRPIKWPAPVKVRGWSDYRLDDGIRALIAMGCALEFLPQSNPMLKALKWNTTLTDSALGSFSPIGLGFSLDDCIRELIDMGCPIEFTKERDELAGNGSGSDLYTLKWITPVKDADGEMR